MKSYVLFLPALLIAVCLASSPALAKAPDFTRGHWNPDKEANVNTAPQEEKAVIAKDKAAKPKLVGLAFTENEKATIRNYLRSDFQRNCPPGLAKKKKACLPPGQAKKYGIGDPLPFGYASLPRALADVLGPPPAGVIYGMIDKDVVLATEGSKKILDAVTLFSAIK